MQGEKIKMPLAPLALHPAALEDSVVQPLTYHKKVIVRFGLVQALVFVLLWLAYVVVTVLPTIDTVRAEVKNALINANFSQVVIKNGQLSIDIKPAIWNFQVSSDSTVQYFVVVDTTGKMNRYFWDDLYVDGHKMARKGVQFTNSNVILRMRGGDQTMSYSQLGLKEGKSYTKAELNTKVESFLSVGNVTVVVLLGMVFVFTVAFVLGIALHFVFGLVIGYLVSMLHSQLTEDPPKCIKMAWSIYIPYFFVMAATALIVYLCTKTTYILLTIMILQILLLPIFVFLLYLQAKTLSLKNSAVSKPMSPKIK